MESGEAAAMMKRYEKLGLGDALGRHYDYPWACHELSLILRIAYPKLPKNLQALVFRDTLSAFRLLPELQICHGISSANLLLQAAETSLPKQKRSLAVSEFKHAVIAYKRQGKACQDQGSLQLPQDILVHVFSFLDVRSIVNASSVCWAWHSAAADNTLWRSQYSLMFGDYDNKTTDLNQKLSETKEVVLHSPVKGDDSIPNIDWREIFKRKFIGNLAWRTATHRAICGHCKSIIWLSNMTSAASHQCQKVLNKRSLVNPISGHKVVDYLLGETDFTASSSDSDDSDSDAPSVIQRMRKLWVYPKLANSEEKHSEI